LSTDEVFDLREVTYTALREVRDIAGLLTDAQIARPGSLAHITATVNTPRIVADQLEALTDGARRRGPRT
jgi:hypothetical protein